MEGLKGFRWCFIVISSMALVVMMSAMPVNGQISTACTNSMITGFTPCLSYITGSSANGSLPTAACCSSLSSLMSSSMDCACLLISGNVPLTLPAFINRTLTLSLPSACKMSGVPLQCQASGSPLPAPGPSAPSPTAALSPSPTASAIPESTTPDLVPTGLPPASTPASSSTTGIRLSPSAANPSQSFSPSLLLFVIGVVVLNYH